MDLRVINLNGLGRFTDTPGGFRVERYHLEDPWPYIYTTPKILLRVDQRGPDYVQFSPPGGALLIRRERFQQYPSLMVWIKTPDNRAFTNFWNANTPGVEPEEFFCDYAPERALYHVLGNQILCETELFVPEDDAVVVMSCTVTNPRSTRLSLELIPAMRPHLAAGSLAPWDVPSNYQKVGYSNDQCQTFLLELRSPAGVPSLREYAFVLSDLQPQSVELDCSRYIGGGAFDHPAGLAAASFPIDASEKFTFGSYDLRNSINGQQSVIAMRQSLELAPGESHSFTMVFGSVDVNTEGAPPTREQVLSFARYLEPRTRVQAVDAVRASTSSLMGKRRMSTPDAAFDRYVNEFLPLQLKWVGVLDRGWPTGMRGVRDNSQDVTAMVPLDPSHARQTLLNLFSVQRSDGWFPRQYSVRGTDGQHDLRNYVDGGVWVWELLHDYLCFSKDTELLDVTLPWLDSDEESTVRDHVVRLADYYLSPGNLGEHGLCLIREGDWNDSVNRAGLDGRGESVMVSCQVVMMLKQMEALAASIPSLNSKAGSLSTAILSHALNSEGYLNGVFNDDGRWIFSPADPDGKRRVNVPVNAFGIISGVLQGEMRDRVLDILRQMKQTDGWPLFYPAIGDPPIDKLGRIGQGDLAPGLGENGTPYNHGCHGFSGRAAAAARDGDLLLEILRYMLPYDQQAHPVDRAKTAPYGVVNHWKTAPGLEGRGGDCFLSGSISTALRNVYGGMFGIIPTADGLVIRPALPSEWPEASVEFGYLGARIRATYKRGGEAGVTVDGVQVADRWRDPVLDTDDIIIPDRLFKQGARHEIVVGLG